MVEAVGVGNESSDDSEPVRPAGKRRVSLSSSDDDDDEYYADEIGKDELKDLVQLSFDNNTTVNDSDTDY